jgi:hypothetical protein
VPENVDALLECLLLLKKPIGESNIPMERDNLEKAESHEVVISALVLGRVKGRRRNCCQLLKRAK